MNREKLERQLEEVVWRDREFDRHKALLKAAVVEVAKRDRRSFLKKVQIGLVNAYMNKKIVVLTLVILFVVIGGGLGSILLRKNPSTLPLAKVLVPDVAAQTLVMNALEKVKQINNLSPEEEKKLIEEKIKEGLISPGSPIASMYEKWSPEERIISFERMYKNLEKTLNEARQAQDLKIIDYTDTEEIKRFFQGSAVIAQDMYYFTSEHAFGYAGPRIGVQIESKDDEERGLPSFISERMMSHYHELGYSSSTIAELLRPARKDEKASFIFKGITDISADMSFKPLPEQVVAAMKLATSTPFGTSVFFTDSQGSPTLVLFNDKEGLPQQMTKRLINNDQIREVVEQNFQKIVERIPEGYYLATLTPSEAAQEIVYKHDEHDWDFLGLDWEAMKRAEATFDFKEYAHADSVERYTEKRSTGAITYVWMKSGQAILSVIRFPYKAGGLQKDLARTRYETFAAYKKQGKVTYPGKKEVLQNLAEYKDEYSWDFSGDDWNETNKVIKSFNLYDYNVSPDFHPHRTNEGKVARVIDDEKNTVIFFMLNNGGPSFMMKGIKK